jgi:hypothetical protein
MPARIRCYSLCVTLAAGLAGCDAEAPQVVRRASVAHAPPARGMVLGGERVDRHVQWPRQIDADALAALPADSRAALASAPAPVLVPPAAHALAGGTLITGESWWAYTASSNGMTVAVQASTRARLYPHVGAFEPRDTVRGLPALVQQAHRIWTLSWIENGTAYSLEIECESPELPPCRDDSQARALADALVNVKGAG